MSQLVTADAVLLDLRPARIPTRLLSMAIDLLLIGGASWLYVYLMRDVSGSDARIRAISIAGSLIISFGYPITMETLTRGRTVGKYALGLRAVRDDGGAIRFRQALLRGLAFWTVDFAIWTGLCGGLVSAAMHPMSKRFGDLMAGTIVIRIRAPQPPDPIPPVPPELAGWAAQLELSRLSDELVNASRHFVQRAGGLAPYPREQLARELARQVAALIAPPPPPGLEAATFLAAVVAERRQRESSRVHHHQWVPAAEELPAGWR